MKKDRLLPFADSNSHFQGELIMMKTISRKGLSINEKVDNMLRYHRFVNLARCHSDLMGKQVQKAESKRIREKILFNLSLSEGKKICRN